MNNQQPPRLCAYWLGYRSKIDKTAPTPPLEATPDYVDVVVLAFALVRENNSIDTSFMFNPPNTEQSIIDGVKALHKQGTKVMLSVGGWAGNCWNSVTDVSTLANNIMKVVHRWGLDGVDIDFEGDRALDDWMKLPLCSKDGNSPPTYWESLFKTLRTKLGPDGLLTAVTASKTFYESSLDELSWVFTMDYGSTSLYDTLTTKYMSNHPDTNFVPYVLGVSCIKPGVWGHMTVQQVKDACAVKSPVGPLSMQFWDLSEDVEAYTNQQSGIYLKTIEDNLPKR